MAIAVFGGIFVILGLIYSLILPNDTFSKIINEFVSKNILILGFLISLAAVVSSLIYSDVIGYPPCMFCWYARVMFYPQLFLFAHAFIKKDRNILPYALILTTIGTLITLYHSIIVMIGESAIPCTVSGVSCLTRDVFMYGFITIPFMGLVGFAVLFLSLIVAKKNK